MANQIELVFGLVIGGMIAGANLVFLGDFDRPVSFHTFDLAVLCRASGGRGGGCSRRSWGLRARFIQKNAQNRAKQGAVTLFGYDIAGVNGFLILVEIVQFVGLNGYGLF